MPHENNRPALDLSESSPLNREEDASPCQRDLLASAVLRQRHRDALERLTRTPEFQAKFSTSRELAQEAEEQRSAFRQVGELVEYLDLEVRPRLEEFASTRGVGDVWAAEIVQTTLAWIVDDHPDPADPAAIDNGLDLARELIDGRLASAPHPSCPTGRR